MKQSPLLTQAAPALETTATLQQLPFRLSEGGEPLMRSGTTKSSENLPCKSYVVNTVRGKRRNTNNKKNMMFLGISTVLPTYLPKY